MKGEGGHSGADQWMFCDEYLGVKKIDVKKYKFLISIHSSIYQATIGSTRTFVVGQIDVQVTFKIKYWRYLVLSIFGGY